MYLAKIKENEMQEKKAVEYNFLLCGKRKIKVLKREVQQISKAYLNPPLRL